MVDKFLSLNNGELQEKSAAWSGLDKTGSSLADIANRDHSLLQNTGVYTHAQIDAHIDNTNNPHNVTANQVLPPQSGNAGKFLKTDGTNVSWATPEGGGGGESGVGQVLFMYMFIAGAL